MHDDNESPPRAPPIKYTAPLGTRWAKEKAAAGGAAAFDLPTDPKSIGPWILGECIGKGASGRVKLARHRRTRQLVAVKILPIAPLVSSRASLATQQAKSEKQRLGIDREITMMKLMNHPNIMRIYDVYEGEKELFLVLEYVEGGELFDFLVNRGRLPPNEALLYFRQIIYGLNYAHTFSIIHRDLKPENILIASLNPPTIKIADWGMAAFAPPTLQLETSCGSPHYASPEIVNGEKYFGTATDIWSCGVILYALLTGRLPFDDKNVRTLLSKVKSGKYDIPAWIDPLAKDLLTRMLVVDVKKRITIPEVLIHPWFVKIVPASVQPGSEGSIPLSPSLPPSPSTLARPIASPDLIDPELFASLRIIWGRHADNQGFAIQRDLCSPAGKGVHAKAFYFLLNKYREESLRNRSNDADDEHQSTSSVNLQTVKLNLGWELDQSRGPRKIDTGMGLSSAHHPVPPRSEKSDLVSKPSDNLSLNPIHTAHNRIGTGEQTTGPVPAPGTRSSRSSRIPPDTRKNQVPHPSSGTAAARSSAPPLSIYGAPRPIPPRRGYTNSVSNTQSPTSLEQRRATDPVISVGSQTMSVISSPTPRQGHFHHDHRTPAETLYPARSNSAAASQQNREVQNRGVSVHSPAPIHSPRLSSDSAMDVDLPVLLSPKTTNVELQRTMDEIADRVNGIVHAAARSGGLQSMMAAIDAPVIADAEMSTIQPRVAPQQLSAPTATGRQSLPPTSRSVDATDKENMSATDDGWTHVEADAGRGTGLSVGGNREVGKDIGNDMDPGNAAAPSKAKRDKARKSRPPPIELPSAYQRRPMLGSPIHAASPAMPGSANTARVMPSPVVGEFKGWFSNLFNWKGHNTGSQTSVFYSSEALPKTREVTIRLFQSLGFSISRPVLDVNSDNSDIYHCRLDQFIVDPQTSLSLKPTRFRVEFGFTIPRSPVPPASAAAGPDSSYFAPIPTPGPSFLATPSPAFNFRPRHSLMMGRSSSNNTPLPTPLGLSQWELPPGCACVIVLAYEKGSASTFKIIRQKLKEMFTDSLAMVVSPCFSPALPNTPFVETHQKAAV